MSVLKPFRILLSLGLLMAAATAWAVTDPAASAVHVRYAHPESFTEARQTPPGERQDARSYLAPLKHYIQHRASRVLQPGQQLSIVVTDVDRAGQYEPLFGAQNGWMRVIRGTYPPRIDLHFTLRNAQGTVVKQGTRKLLDLGFMDTISATDTDPLRYEKALVDRWLRHGEDGM